MIYWLLYALIHLDGIPEVYITNLQQIESSVLFGFRYLSISFHKLPGSFHKFRQHTNRLKLFLQWSLLSLWHWCCVYGLIVWALLSFHWAAAAQTILVSDRRRLDRLKLSCIQLKPMTRELMVRGWCEFRLMGGIAFLALKLKAVDVSSVSLLGNLSLYFNLCFPLQLPFVESLLPVCWFKLIIRVVLYLYWIHFDLKFWLGLLLVKANIAQR